MSVNSETADFRVMWRGKTLMRDTGPKTPKRIFDLDVRPEDRQAYLDARANDPYVVCFLGSAGAMLQLHEILRDFVPPDNIAWVVANHGDVSEAVVETVASRDSVVLIGEGSVEPLVEKKVYVVASNCSLFIRSGAKGGRELEGLALGQPEEGEFEYPWFRHTAEVLALGSHHRIRVVFL